MASSTPFFQAFGPLLFGRRARSQAEAVRRLEGLEEIYGVFGDMVPEALLGLREAGVNSRERSLPPAVTFWAFVSQALSPKSSCREVVRRIEQGEGGQSVNLALLKGKFEGKGCVREMGVSLEWH